MNILKPFLSPKKLRKLENNPQAFFKDALDKRIIPIQNQLKTLKPKKNHAFAEYYIISAVYNVEKYLDDYFDSILKQRLDFKNNITIICVDDGSTDRSAEIIQNYQKRFPENIVYLHKENGGQASARNLGIKWLQEKLGCLEGADEKIHNSSNKPIWVTFTDPDDFLDRDYFYEVDKFLGKNKSKDIAMVGCNVILYWEEHKFFRNSHPGKFQFQEKFSFIDFSQSTTFGVITSTRSFFDFGIIQKYQILFDEQCKPSFEDVKFIAYYLLPLPKCKILFLKNAKYYARKRLDKTSTLNQSKADIEQYLTSIDKGTLSVLEDYYRYYNGRIPDFIQNACLAHLFYNYKDFVNNPQKLYFMNEQQKNQYLDLLDKNFSLIDVSVIMAFKIGGFFARAGMLHCFKREHPTFQMIYIDGYDVKKEQILIKYFTPNDKEVESIRINGKEIFADYEKIIKYDFLNRVFLYQKRLWIHIPKKSNKLEIFIGGQRAIIVFNNEEHQSLEIESIYDKFRQLKKPKNNLWLLIDRDMEADDNAERLYRYIAKNFPQQNIIFALRKESKDWIRLENEGFNLVEFESIKFRILLRQCSKAISSHLDRVFMKYVHKRKWIDFVCLEHGETIAHNCSDWLNKNSIIKLITLSCEKEYNNIAPNYNKYLLSKKETKVTGFARYDSLLQGNKANTKKILIMPTWRIYLRGVGNGLIEQESKEKIDCFLESEYFIYWNSFLQNQQLEKLAKLYHYDVVFVPHFQCRSFIQCFNIPKYIEIYSREKADKESLQGVFQECSLLITDHSSITFSIAYLKKPTIYFQFEEKDYLQKGHHPREFNFDYRRDGFGPVVTTQEELLQELEILLQKDCKVGEPYKSNIENTFEFRDGKCCERIYKAILELDKPYERKWTLDYVLNLAHNALNTKCYKEASERFRFVLEHLGESEFSNTQVILNEEILFSYLYASRLNQTSQEALEFIKAQEYENVLTFSNQTKLEFIKNYLKMGDKQEVVRRLESIESDKEKDLEFAYLKFRIYAYLEDKERLHKIHNELKSIYGVKEESLNLILSKNEINLILDVDIFSKDKK